VDLSAQRAAENEDLFRRINERVEELTAERYDLLPIVCECSDAVCTERLAVSREDYERVRAHGERFFVAPGHAVERVETVLEDHGGWLVVEKRGEAGEVARETDPRSE
jgi:hypothetical protein